MAETRATAFLKKHGIAYTEHFYDYVEHGGTAVSSAALGVAEHCVVKTLVMQDDRGRPLVVLMHGDFKVCTRALARQVGAKRVEPCRPQDVERHCGYQVGGCSPFGLRKPLAICMERSILALERIYINGGRRGFLVGLDPKEIVRTLSPVLVEVGARD